MLGEIHALLLRIDVLLQERFRPRALPFFEGNGNGVVLPMRVVKEIVPP